MSINFETTTPKALLTAFKKAIDDGRVVTWAYDKDGDFVHTPQQWNGEAWLRPKIYEGVLTMVFLGRKDQKTSKAVYGVYHGRFIESMLTHCDDLFMRSYATAMPTNADVVTA